MHTIKFLPFILLAFVACKEESKTPPPPGAEPTTKPIISTDCFLLANGADSMAMQITIDRGKVTGFVALVPSGNDKTLASIQGQLQDDIITGQLHYVLEGPPQTEEIMIKMGSNTATRGVGELQPVNGGMAFKDKAAVQYKDEYKKVDCLVISKFILMVLNEQTKLKRKQMLQKK